MKMRQVYDKSSRDDKLENADDCGPSVILRRCRRITLTDRVSASLEGWDKRVFN